MYVDKLVKYYLHKFSLFNLLFKNMFPIERYNLLLSLY